MSVPVTVERDGDVATVTFRRPKEGNQVNVATMRALISALEDALRPLGVEVREKSPMTPEYVREKIRTARDGE